MSVGTEATWNASENAGELLDDAARARVERARLMLATCACARLTLVHVPPHEDRPRRAIEVAEAYARHRATDDEMYRARMSVHVVLTTSGSPYYDYASGAVREVFADRAPSQVTHYVIGAVRHTTWRAWAGRGRPVRVDVAAGREAGRRMATLVREVIPWALVASVR